jgi:hypothetical protein
MIELRLCIAAVIAATAFSPATAANLSITRSTTIVTDQVSTLNPKALPGATVDYTVLVTNPLANLFTPVTQVVITEPIAADLKLWVDNISGSSGGPIEFKDGGALNLGLNSSGLTYTYSSLTSTTDKVEFFDGTSWTYQPVSTGGFDGNVRAIRITLTGTHTAGGSFQLRYRVQVK